MTDRHQTALAEIEQRLGDAHDETGDQGEWTIATLEGHIAALERHSPTSVEVLSEAACVQQDCDHYDVDCPTHDRPYCAWCFGLADDAVGGTWEDTPIPAGAVYPCPDAAHILNLYCGPI